MFKKFPLYQQRDAMDCGPACLQMVAAFYGKFYPLAYLRDNCFLSREGVSILGIAEGAEKIGFKTMATTAPYKAGKGIGSLLAAPKPAIVHWNQNNFVVVYKMNERFVWVADPGQGKFKLKRSEFEKSWHQNTGVGITLLLETTPDFYSLNSILPPDKTNLGAVFLYVKPYRKLVIQMLIGMLVSSALQLFFPFMMQSIVDVGIENRNFGFITLILIGQLMLFFAQNFVQFLQNRILLHTGTRINVALISDFLIKLMRLPIGFFDTKMTGDLMQRIGDQSRIEAFLTQSSLSIIFSVLNFIVFSSILFIYNHTIFSFSPSLPFCISLG